MDSRAADGGRGVYSMIVFGSIVEQLCRDSLNWNGWVLTRRIGGVLLVCRTLHMSTAFRTQQVLTSVGNIGAMKLPFDIHVGSFAAVSCLPSYTPVPIHRTAAFMDSGLLNHLVGFSVTVK